jgi:Tfp pilus assembly protein PilX
MAVPTPAKRGFVRPLIVVLVVIVIVAVLGYGYASPYLALDRLKRAADARDAQTVSKPETCSFRLSRNAG